jgi:hypothetical protein
MNESEKQFSFTRAASSTSGRVKKQIIAFAQGGHLGNLSNPTVQKTILGALTNMKSSPSKPD